MSLNDKAIAKYFDSDGEFECLVYKQKDLREAVLRLKDIIYNFSRNENMFFVFEVLSKEIKEIFGEELTK